MREPLGTLEPNGKDWQKRVWRNFNGEAHYIDRLMDLQEPKYYEPPCIFDRFGKRMDLGLNEEQILFDGDICTPCFKPHIYHGQRYGIFAELEYVALKK